ncbi:MAG TPA: type II toxin-antitoxin system VapC family toxin [Mycobacteriales bacterium]|nr:type II toxin-antitoxin system VapC family toxin [Mycobacteriales bacterium]
MRAILDTSVLVASALPALDDELAISIVSLAELHFGVLVAGPDDVRAERLRRVALIERLFDPLPVDERVARSYGHLAATVAKAGRNPRGRIMDLLIAATAHAHEARLYTRNAADLRGLDGLLEIVPI